MTLLTPVALALTALSAPVILMYILKLRRQPKVVSSTFLWRKALDDVQANAPWQRLRISALLILQLLALLALVLIQTRPAYSTTQRFNGDLILIVDQSYGMQAHDVHPSRFAAALSQAKTFASQVPSGDVVSVIGMGAHPTLAIAESTSQGNIDGSIDSLKVGVSPPNFLESMSLASSLARSGQATRAVVLTSRQSGISSLPIQISFPVTIDRIGGKLRDMGITAFGASSGVNGTDALVRLENFGTSKEQSDLNLYVDGQLADVRPVSLAPLAQSTQFWTNLPGHASVLHAVLSVKDDVVSDKQAWSLVSSAPPRHVLLVTAGDYFLQTALTLDPSIILSTISSSNYVPAQDSNYDLVVFDGMLPVRLPATPALIISPPKGTVGPMQFGSEAATGPVTPAPAPPAVLAPVLQNVEVSDVHVAEARRTVFPSSLQPLFAAGNRTILAAGQIDGQRVVTTTFSLQQSDWPLRVSFPILIQNLVQSYLVPSIGVSSASISAGDIINLSPEPGVKQIDITSPTGAVDRISRPFPPFTNTSVPGVYTVRESGKRFSSHFVVNLLPARPAPATGPSEITFGKGTGGQTKATSAPNELGWIMALVCLGLLSAEWWLAFRR